MKKFGLLKSDPQRAFPGGGGGGDGEGWIENLRLADANYYI